MSVRAFGRVAAIVVGSGVVWAPVWWLGSGELPRGEFAQVLTACAVSLAGGIACRVPAPRLGVLVRVLCVFAAAALAFLALLVWVAFGPEDGADRTASSVFIPAVLVYGAIGMTANAVRRSDDVDAGRRSDPASAHQTALDGIESGDC